MTQRDLVDRVAQTAALSPSSDGEDDAGLGSGSDDDVRRPRRAVHVVPRTKRSFLPLDEQNRLAGEQEEALLGVLGVVHGHRLSRTEHLQSDADLREANLRPLEPGRRSGASERQPFHVACVHDEPAFTGRDESCLPAFQGCLGNHGP